ncbi:MULTISPECIES: hypothetical protein [unclassified Nostoc]|nr:hypothetical protein [Nostoc sp. JL33]
MSKEAGVNFSQNTRENLVSTYNHLEMVAASSLPRVREAAAH